jgi:hypothetical protein
MRGTSSGVKTERGMSWEGGREGGKEGGREGGKTHCSP